MLNFVIVLNSENLLDSKPNIIDDILSRANLVNECCNKWSFSVYLFEQWLRPLFSVV